MSGFIRIDTNGVISKVNKEFCKLSGYKQDNLVGNCYIPPLDAVETGSYRKFKCEPKLPLLTDKKIQEIWKTINGKKTWK